MTALFVQAAELGMAVQEAGQKVRAGSLMAENDKIVHQCYYIRSEAPPKGSKRFGAWPDLNSGDWL